MSYTLTCVNIVCPNCGSVHGYVYMDADNKEFQKDPIDSTSFIYKDCDNCAVKGMGPASMGALICAIIAIIWILAMVLIPGLTPGG